MPAKMNSLKRVTGYEKIKKLAVLRAQVQSDLGKTYVHTCARVPLTRFSFLILFPPGRGGKMYGRANNEKK